MDALGTVKAQIFLVVVAARSPRPTDLSRWERAALGAIGNLACALDSAADKGSDPRRLAPIRAEAGEWEGVARFLAAHGRPRGLKALKALK